ncbi:MAG: GTP cyclohydrolase II [Steroidobacteraceae bacterium]
MPTVTLTPPLDRLNGDMALLAVDRAVGELRRGRVVCVSAAPDAVAVLVAAAETARQTVLTGLRARAPLALVLAQDRAVALAVDSGAAATRLLLPADADAALVMALTAGAITPTLSALAATLSREPAVPSAVAAASLAKHAGLLPAVVAVAFDSAAAEVPADMLRVDAADIARFEQPQDADLERVSDARVPLEDNEDCELVVFRDARNGTEHLAVILGRPVATTPVRVRMHSSCLTGDLLGSLRCDCGDQLRRAVQQLSGEGGGVLLYLSQEGRGIGLASKLRAYRLQDAGLDTLDANNHLGFQADERSFDMAAQMLRALGLSRIRLLTSNPWKVKALRAAGIDVVAQEPLHGRINRHNARYIQVKQERAGHLPRDLSDALGPDRK